MGAFKNKGSIYELVDTAKIITYKTCKCAVCGGFIYRNHEKTFAAYAQLGGVLIQKKSFHMFCSPPKLYKAGKGFIYKCEKCNCTLTPSEIVENEIHCHKCFDKAFEEL